MLRAGESPETAEINCLNDSVSCHQTKDVRDGCSQLREGVLYQVLISLSLKAKAVLNLDSDVRSQTWLAKSTGWSPRIADCGSAMEATETAELFELSE